LLNAVQNYAMEEANVTIDYISVGGNRHPAAADWDRGNSGLLAFGADNNIALWDPLVCHSCTDSDIFLLSIASFA
jgi:elongator complex protein 2